MIYEGYCIEELVHVWNVYANYDAWRLMEPILHTAPSLDEAKQWVDQHLRHDVVADTEVTITEYMDNITAHIPGIRETAELSQLGQLGTEIYGLEPKHWLWFNRLINQSGIPHVGTLLLDKVLEYCKEKNYSIANQVSAYGDISQQDLENWYIRKGFVPVDYSKYGNAFLKWVPE